MNMLGVQVVADVKCYYCGHISGQIVGRKGEPLRDLVTGFLKNGKVLGRPCDIMKLDANSFLFSDDHTGVVCLVRKKRFETN